MMLTQERLKELLYYHPRTGVWLWRVSRGGVSAHSEAGTLVKGYVHIRIDGRTYKAHRLAFLYMTGIMPIMVDHRDTDTANNSWENLRECTRSQNNCNRGPNPGSKSGVKGVYPCGNRFLGCVTYLGEGHRKYFDSIEEAAEWVEFVRAEIHKEFAR